MIDRRWLLTGILASLLPVAEVAAAEPRLRDGLWRYFNMLHGAAGGGDREQVIGAGRMAGSYEIRRVCEDGSEAVESLEFGRDGERHYVRLAFGRAVASSAAASGYFTSEVTALEFAIGADGALRAVAFVPERRRGLLRPEVATARAVEGEASDITIAADGRRRREAWVAQVDLRRRALLASGLLQLHGFGR